MGLSGENCVLLVHGRSDIVLHVNMTAYFPVQECTRSREKD